MILSIGIPVRSSNVFHDRQDHVLTGTVDYRNRCIARAGIIRAGQLDINRVSVVVDQRDIASGRNLKCFIDLVIPCDRNGPGTAGLQLI